MLKLVRILAWLLVAALALATLSPLELRPHLSDSATLERALAYGLVGLVFGIAYPRQRLYALAFVVGVAGLLELGQMLTQTRHGRMPDFLVKALSAGIGLAIGAILLDIRARLPARS